MHANCALGMREPIGALNSIVSFLQSNPNEVIIMPTQIDYGTGGEVTLAEIDAVFEQVPGFKSLMYNHEDGSLWPTLGELIEADTRILFFHYNGQQCSGSNAVACPEGFHDWFSYAGETEFQFTSASQFQNVEFSCLITRGSGSLDFYGVNVFLQIPNLSTCGELNTREFLIAHVEACSTFTSQDVNLILVDCWDEGDVLDIAREYNESL